MTPRPRVICGISSSSTTSILRLSPTKATASPLGRHADPRGGALARGQHLLAGAGLGHAPPRRRRQSRARRSPRPAAPCRAGRGTSRRCRARSAGRSSAAAARHGRARRAAGRPRAYRTGRWCRRRSAGRWSRPATAKRGPSPSLYFCSAAATLCPLTARIQPLAEHSTVTGSRSTSASAGISIAAGAAAISVRRRPSGGVAAELRRRSRATSLAIARPLPPVARRAARSSSPFLGGERVELLADLDLLEPAQARAAAC